MLIIIIIIIIIIKIYTITFPLFYMGNYFLLLRADTDKI